MKQATLTLAVIALLANPLATVTAASPPTQSSFLGIRSNHVFLGLCTVAGLFILSQLTPQFKLPSSNPTLEPTADAAVIVPEVANSSEPMVKAEPIKHNAISQDETEVELDVWHDIPEQEETGEQAV